MEGVQRIPGILTIMYQGIPLKQGKRVFLTIKLDTCELWVPPGEFWVTLPVDHIRTESQEVGRLFGVMLLFKESNSSKTL